LPIQYALNIQIFIIH